MKLLLESERKIGKNPFDFLAMNVIPNGSFVSIGYINDHEISWGPKTRKAITPENDAKLTAYLENLPDSKFKAALQSFQESPKYQAALQNGKTAPLDFGGECHIVKVGRFTLNWKSNSSLAKFYAERGEAIGNVRVKHGFGGNEEDYAEDDWRRNPKYRGIGRNEVAGDPNNPNKFKGNIYKERIGGQDSGFWTDPDNQKVAIRLIQNPRAGRKSLWYFIDAEGVATELDNELMAFLTYAYKGSKKTVQQEVKEINQEEQAFLDDLKSIKNIDKSEMTLLLDNILYINGTTVNSEKQKEPFTWLNDDIIESLYPYIGRATLDQIIAKSVKISKKEVNDMNEGLVFKSKKSKSLNESRRPMSKSSKLNSQALYESIMKKVAKEVKRTLNESDYFESIYDLFDEYESNNISVGDFDIVINGDLITNIVLNNDDTISIWAGDPEMDDNAEELILDDAEQREVFDEVLDNM